MDCGGREGRERGEGEREGRERGEEEREGMEEHLPLQIVDRVGVNLPFGCATVDLQ